MTTSVAPTTNQNQSSDTSSRIVAKSLGKDDFLKLMIEQMKAQNPLEPMSDTDSIAQLANFSSLEQMQNMNNNLQTLIATFTMNMQDSSVGYAVSLIGKEVGFYDGTTTQWGKVDSIKIMDGNPMLVVGDWLLGLDRIFEVKPVVQESEETQEVDNGDQSDDDSTDSADTGGDSEGSGT
ncbi:MAG: hypothetical protein HPY50_14870 [Firmicutes bacterium]|nr:hypothetical protein [Bacillota bacterium]